MTPRFKEIASAWVVVAVFALGLAVYPEPSMFGSADRLTEAGVTVPGRSGWQPSAVHAGLPSTDAADPYHAEDDAPVWQRGLMSVRASTDAFSAAGTEIGAMCPVGLMPMDVGIVIDTPESIAC